MRILVLGGTAEARALSHELERRPGTEVLVSLAGVTEQPAPHGGQVRSGGFGGSSGLARYLEDEGVDVVLDATHPFAERISTNAAAAAERAAVPLLRLVRPAWEAQPGDRWIEVDDLAEAAAALPELPARCALLALGRQHLAPFAAIEGVKLVVRAVEPPDLSAFPGAVAEVGRGPFTVDAELDLLRRHEVDAVVARNSGGDDAKLVAARTLGLPVVLVRRPPSPGAAVADIAAVLGWLEREALDRSGGPGDRP